MANTPTDEHILALLRADDTARQGFNLLVRKYQQVLYGQIRRLVVDHDDTDDLLQSTFIKAWENIANFRGESALSTWLYRIATNEALGHLRKKKRRNLVSINDVDGELAQKIATLPATEAGPDADAIRRKLQMAILQLPERQRAVFQFRYYDEMPYEEIAKVMGTSVGSLKASYHHAAHKIEAYLKRD